MFFLFSSFSVNTSLAQVTVSSSTTWTTLPSGYEDGITINSNIQLSIGLLTLNMNTGKSITLNSGAKLILNGTVIQASGLGSNTWTGILATGTGNEQFSTFPDPKTKNSTLAWSGVLDGSQTKVELSNNAQIINAEIGIKSTSGAIIRSRESTFLNCEIGIQIDAYRSISNEKMNACFFMQDQFLWDNDIESITSYDFSNLIGIKITNAGAINIGGCIFENSNSTAHCLNEKGIGINALNSDFTVEKDGDKFCVTLDCASGSEGAENCYTAPATGNGCQFNNLFRGIDFVSQSSRNDQFITRYNSFNDNFLSIYIERCNAAGIYDNNFSTIRSNLNSFYDNTGCSGATYNSSSVLTNISANGAHQLRILQNDFISDDQYVEHLVINNCYSTGTSLIKANTMSSSTTGYDIYDEVIGILSQGNNTGLNIYCNTFQDLGVDIWNVSGATLSNQPLQAGYDANNSFSSTAGIQYRYNIFNDGNNFNYVRKPGEFIVRGGSNQNTFNSAVNNPPNCTINCSDLTDIVDNSGVGIQEVRNLYSIFPNPANHIIQIAPFGIIDFDVVVLYSFQGSYHSVLEKELQSENSYFLPDVSSGIYFLKIYSKQNNVVTTNKLVILKD